jgi:hypothetical protein
MQGAISPLDEGGGSRQVAESSRQVAEPFRQYGEQSGEMKRRDAKVKEKGRHFAAVPCFPPPCLCVSAFHPRMVPGTARRTEAMNFQSGIFPGQHGPEGHGTGELE